MCRVSAGEDYRVVSATSLCHSRLCAAACHALHLRRERCIGCQNFYVFYYKRCMGCEKKFMYSTAWCRVAVYRSMLQCVAVCCGMLYSTAWCCMCIFTPYIYAPTATCALALAPAASTTSAATHCNTLQHTATHCNTLQHTTTHCNILQHTATRRTRSALPAVSCEGAVAIHL